MKNNTGFYTPKPLDPKKEMPFFGLLKQEIFGKVSLKELKKEDIDFLRELTRDIIKIAKEEIKLVDFWESYERQNRLKSSIIECLLQSDKGLFEKRNEIAQKLMELIYHVYGDNKN